MFWLIAALLTLVALGVMLLPFWRARTQAGDVSPDALVYRDQLEEIERDQARGVLSTDEAHAARAEVGRRLLNIGTRRQSAQQVGRKFLVPPLLLLVIAALALPIYLSLGRPALQDQPLHARVAAPLDQQNLSQLIARMEQVLAANPNEGKGWELIAPVYLRLGRFADAANAYQRTIELLGPTADRYAALGEAQMSENGGEVTASATANFLEALKLDGGNHVALFQLARGAEQRNRPDLALQMWQRLIAVSTPTDPWVPFAAERVAALTSDEPAVDPVGPTQDDVAAAQEMSAEDRMAMVNTMVANLADRLAEDPDDIEGWLRLIRSYRVLERPDDAVAALKSARTTFAERSEALARLAALATELGMN